MSVSVQPTPLMETYPRRDLAFTKGLGCTLYDADGNSYLDMVAGIAVASVGHSHPAIVEAVSGQVARLTHVSNLYRTAPQEELATRLADLTRGTRSFFCNSGAEAIECALKLVRRWAAANGKGTGIVAAEGGFHGRTLGALSVTGQPAKRVRYEPLLGDIEFVRFGDLDALDAIVDDRVAAVLLEPIQGEAGVIVPPPGYLAGVRALCDERGVLLMLDEIQTGLARTGAWFAHQHEEIAPDVMCLAKALAGGLPMGACLAIPSVAAAFEIGDHATTFGGGPVQSAAAMAVLDVIETEGLVERSGRYGTVLMESLERALEGRATVRGKGLMVAVELRSAVAGACVDAAIERGVLLNEVTPTTLRLTPPLVITDAEIDVAVQVIEEVVGELSET